MITAARWLEVLGYCGVHATTAVKWAPLFAKHIQAENFSLGRRELDDFVGQVLHETAMLERLEENLNYSAKRLTEVWPGRFPNLAAAAPYAYNPEALAEKAYGMREDLGNDTPGDGLKYLGRGIPMITGKANYALLEGLTGEPLVDFPVMLQNPDIALRCALLWWERRVPDSAIDTIERVSRAVNGGLIGLQDRRQLTAKAGEVLA
jgi:putative chitinase